MSSVQGSTLDFTFLILMLHILLKSCNGTKWCITCAKTVLIAWRGVAPPTLPLFNGLCWSLVVCRSCVSASGYWSIHNSVKLINDLFGIPTNWMFKDICSAQYPGDAQRLKMEIDSRCHPQLFVNLLQLSDSNPESVIEPNSSLLSYDTDNMWLDIFYDMLWKLFFFFF